MLGGWNDLNKQIILCSLSYDSHAFVSWLKEPTNSSKAGVISQKIGLPERGLPHPVMEIGERQSRYELYEG